MAKVFLDKERELHFDLNAIDKIYEKKGINYFDREDWRKTFSTLTPTNVKVLVWACLQGIPELTLEEVGRLIPPKNMEAVITALASVLQEVENPLPDTGPSASSTQT